MGVTLGGSNDKCNESFRISVNLSQFFEDERAQCYISVQGDHPVRWLRRRLRKLFNIPKSVSFLSHGHLLPPDEPLSLLRPDDPVEVIKSYYTKNGRHAGDVSENSSQELCEQDLHPKKKKPKLSENKDISIQDTSINKNISDDIEINESLTNITDGPAMQESSDVADGIINDEELSAETTQLQKIKEQALALLQSYDQTSEAQETMNAPMRTRRVRRRVRRRKPPALPLPLPPADPRHVTPSPPSPLAPLVAPVTATPQPPPATTSSTWLSQDPDRSKTSCPETDSTQKQANVSPSQHSPETAPTPTLSYCEKEAAVIRNDEIAPRTPRVVRPLNMETVASC